MAFEKQVHRNLGCFITYTYFILVFIKEKLEYLRVRNHMVGAKGCHLSRFQLATKTISEKLVISLGVIGM